MGEIIPINVPKDKSSLVYPVALESEMTYLVEEFPGLATMCKTDLAKIATGSLARKELEVSLTRNEYLSEARGIVEDETTPYYQPNINITVTGDMMVNSTKTSESSRNILRESMPTPTDWQGTNGLKNIIWASVACFASVLTWLVLAQAIEANRPMRTIHYGGTSYERPE